MSHYVSPPPSQLDFNVYFQLLMDQYLGRNGLKEARFVKYKQNKIIIVVIPGKLVNARFRATQLQTIFLYSIATRIRKQAEYFPYTTSK